MRKILVLVLMLLMHRGLAAQTTQPSPTSSISGQIRVPAGAVPAMIVYLEPVDPGVHFAPPPDADISQKGAKFSPPLLVISVGQSVLFKNDEQVTTIEHNVFSRSPVQPFDLGLFLPPQAKRVTFNSPGIVRLYCSIHRLMDGMIYVCPTPFWARVEADGRFSIPNVPAGNWRIKTWQQNPKYSEQEAPVQLSSAPANINLTLDRKEAALSSASEK